VADGKVGFFEALLGAFLKVLLEVAFIHVLDEVERTGPELNAVAAITVPPKGFAFRSPLAGKRECRDHQQAEDRQKIETNAQSFLFFMLPPPSLDVGLILTSFFSFLGEAPSDARDASDSPPERGMNDRIGLEAFPLCPAPIIDRASAISVRFH
jgi:hypothetical protein